MTVLIDRLQTQLAERADDVMMVSLADDRSYTGQEIANLVADLADTFRVAGIGKGDVVLLALTNAVSYPVIEQALWTIGAIAHPIAPSSAVTEIKSEFDEYHNVAMIVDDSFQEVLAGDEQFRAQPVALGEWTLNLYHNTDVVPAGMPVDDLADTDLAVILNTSGSTGKPKRVGLTHAQLFNSATHIGESQGLTNADATMVVMPMFHVNAQVISILGTRLSGGKLVVAEKFSASKFWDAVADHGVTWASIVPTIIQILEMNETAKQRFDVRRAEMHIQYVRSASFSLPAESLAVFEATFGIPVIEGYGMTEAASLIALNPFDAPKAGTVGLPVATDIALLVNGELTTDADVAGEILLRGDHVITDYVDSNPSSFYEGWLRTGDLGQFDTEGYLTIVGRIKEIISRGGEKVAPAAIEGAIRQLEFVKDIVVVGLPDKLYGEEVTAVIIVNDGVTLSETNMTKAVLEHAATTLSRPARPTKVVFVTDYPRNPTGKVMRHKLVEQLAQ